jgi:SAM-dependent methyltransferase
MITVDRKLLVDTAAEFNLPPTDYFSLWDDLGSWQFDLLVKMGLKPGHKLLDVGCGALRLGLHAIDYLDDGAYVGVDPFAPYIAMGRDLASKVGLNKQFQLIESSDFDFGAEGPAYDYALAQSVLTHLSTEKNRQCISAVARVMRPGGQFIFTYLPGRSSTVGFLYNGVQPMMRAIDTDNAFLALVAADHKARFEPLEVDHPTGQQVGRMIFS